MEAPFDYHNNREHCIFLFILISDPGKVMMINYLLGSSMRVMTLEQ
jgi:hypothetical protein